MNVGLNCSHSALKGPVRRFMQLADADSRGAAASAVGMGRAVEVRCEECMRPPNPRFATACALVACATIFELAAPVRPARAIPGARERPPPPAAEDDDETDDSSGVFPRLPRGAVIAAYYLGFTFGPAALRDAAAQRSVGSGAAFGLSLGMAFWEEIPINFGFGMLDLEDRTPFTELVMVCTTVNNTSLGCSGPYEDESHVAASYLKLDTGYQRRFRVSRGVALTPGLLIGHQWNPGGVARTVGCKGCTQIPVDGLRAEGSYLAPSLRVTLGRDQFWAVSARWEFFLSDLIAHVGVFGIEFLAP
jgi:hypothetical protein